MKLNFERPLWALALIIMALVLAWQCEGRKNDKLQAELDNQALAEDTTRIQSQLRDSTARIRELVSERVSRQVKFERAVGALNQSVSHWKSEALKNRPAVVLLSDSVPVLKAFLAATDSVIERQDSVIAVQSLHLVSQAKLYENEIAVMGARHVQAMELVDVWKGAAVEREKDLKRSERRKRFWRGVAVITGTAATVLILAQ